MPKPSQVKQRSLNRKIKGGYEENVNTKTKLQYRDGESKGRQYTVSEGHVPSKDGKYRAGGPFYTIRMQQNVGIRSVVLTGGGSNKTQKYVGPITLGAPSLDISDKSIDSFRSRSNFDDLDEDGATAIAQCEPTNPVATLGTGLTEAFKEGLPSLPGYQSWKSRLGILKNAGSEFLNAEFGWLPLVGEVEDTASAIRHHRDVIQQYERDANRQVRRRFVYPEEHSSETLSKVEGRAGFIGGSTGNFNAPTPGIITTTREVTRRRWFEGAFVHPPLVTGDSMTKTLNAGTEADKLFGLSLTPNLLWELTPWSWAADYFTNAGDVIHNVTAMTQYGLIMRYGYMMEEKSEIITRSIDRSGLRKDATGTDVGNCPSSSTVITSKVRRPANPFGFGFTGADLSTTQWAILAAVGISLL